MFTYEEANVLTVIDKNQDPLYGFPVREVELRILNAHRCVQA